MELAIVAGGSGERLTSGEDTPRAAVPTHRFLSDEWEHRSEIVGMFLCRHLARDLAHFFRKTGPAHGNACLPRFFNPHKSQGASGQGEIFQELDLIILALCRIFITPEIVHCRSHSGQKSQNSNRPITNGVFMAASFRRRSAEVWDSGSSSIPNR